MGKLKGLIGIMVVVGAFYVAWNMIPPYFHNSQFQEDLDDIVRRATYNSTSEDDLKQIVIRKALATTEVTLKEDQIKITKTTSGVGISVHYRVHVDMIVHPVDLDFTASSKNVSIISGG